VPNKINHENKKLVVVQGEFPSSSATFILDQITGLIDRGFNVDNWAIFNSGAQITHEDVVKYNLIDKTNYIKLHYYNKKLDASVWVDEFIKANNLPQLSDIDAFHVHYGAVFNQLEPLFKCYNGFVVVSFHGYDASKYFVQHGDDCYSYLFQRANLITTPTYTMKQELVNRGCPAHKILIHRYGVDLQKFTSGEKRHDKTIVLGVGRLEEKKDLNTRLELLQAVKIKKKQNTGSSEMAA